jgi:hypothetical protein
LVFVLQGPLRGLIYTLEAIKEEKEKRNWGFLTPYDKYIGRRWNKW